jgi:RND superfamily putative drug exporter
MSRLGRWCFRRRKWVVAGWLVVLVAIIGLSVSAGSRYNSSLSLPGTDSQAAVNLLTKNFPAASGEGDQVVIQATGGATIRSSQVQKSVTAALGRVAKVPGVAGVVSPYTQAGAGQISQDGTIAFASVTWTKPSADITKTDVQNLETAGETADGPHVHISLGGQAIEKSETPGAGLSVIIGVLAALAVLLIVFGGALASSALPLLTAILALAIGVSFTGLLSHLLEVSNDAPDLAILIGLGVGVDYGLFVISRHRSGIKSDLSYEDAAAQALNTSGRTVLFAGATVCIALLGQLALGVSFLNGISISAAATVALTMAASLTFLPAMLGFLGPRALSRRERAALASAAATDVSPFWLRWARLVETRKAPVALGALAIVAVIAVPIFGLRLGTADASVDPASYTTHQAYDALASGFGPGFNGPLELAGRVTSPAGAKAFTGMLATVSHLPGVAQVTPAQTSPNGKAVLAIVYPTTSPQARQTASLVSRLRADVIPPAEKGTSLQVHVGGVTATNIDFAHVLTTKLPLFIAIVVILAFILLAAVFRSLLIPLVASLMNLLSIGAALGALNAVFNWGWASSLLGLAGTGPIAPFVPVVLFSVLFGLSMDYEVYLVSRIQEEWHHLHHTEPGNRAGLKGLAASRNHEAIVTGQAKAGRIIAAAATIMILVFGSFILDKNQLFKEFGFGLGFSVLLDAFVIRSLLVPAIMHLIGPANWYMPAWLDRILPNLSIETNTESPAGPTAPASRRAPLKAGSKPPRTPGQP